jgi:hypothetical protein
VEEVFPPVVDLTFEITPEVIESAQKLAQLENSSP